MHLSMNNMPTFNDSESFFKTILQVMVSHSKNYFDMKNKTKKFLGLSDHLSYPISKRNAISI